MNEENLTCSLSIRRLRWCRYRRTSRTKGFFCFHCSIRPLKGYKTTCSSIILSMLIPKMREVHMVTVDRRSPLQHSVGCDENLKAQSNRFGATTLYTRSSPCRTQHIKKYPSVVRRCSFRTDVRIRSLRGRT